MSADYFIPSLVTWFSDRAADVCDRIASQSRIQATAADMFRPDSVYDATGRTTGPVAAQRLIRWSTSSPQEVFWHGFRPPSFPEAGRFPQEAFNLKTYADGTNKDSIFVGTTDPYINDQGRTAVWEPSPNSQRFEYEIFAYGGIDVNKALRLSNDHHEIAFPGGIAPAFIRSAREYVDSKIVRIWENTNFDNTANQGHAPSLALLPAARRTPNNAPIQTYPPHNAQPPSDPKFSDPDDLMAEDGENVTDSLYDVTPVPRTCFSCVLHPTSKRQAWFFCGNRYVQIKFTTDQLRDSIVKGPNPIKDDWVSLSDAMFAGGVDAVLLNPQDHSEMYFFSADQYARVNVTADDFVASGPRNIVNGWGSLRTAGFTTVDAVMPSAWGGVGLTYVFSSDKCVVINALGDYVVDGPHAIWDLLPSLNVAGFKTVDATLIHPDDDEKVYVFSGTQYVLIHFNGGRTKDYIVSGPKNIGTEWPSLSKAVFW